MKIIDIVELTAKLLNEIDVKDCVSYCKTNEITLEDLILEQNLVRDIRPDCLTEQSKKILRLILDSANIVQTMIASEYFENYIEEDITVQDDEFDIDNLSQKLFKIKAITKNNVKQYYKLIGDKITLSSGNYKIKYAFLPEDKTFTQSVDNYCGKLSILTFCYGVCSEFCLIKGLYDEAEAWQSKFENSIHKNFKKSNGVYVRPRRWL